MSSDKGKVKLDYKDNLIGAKFSFAGMNFMVDPADLPLDEGQCVDINNCDVDYKNNVSRRQGSTLLQAGQFSNAWSNNTDIYATSNGALVYIFMNNGSPQIIAINGVPILQGIVEFKQVNNVVFFSDGYVCGILEGVVATVFGNSVFNLG